MTKAFKLTPFNRSKEEIPLKTQLFYTDVLEHPEYWKDVVIITSKNLDSLSELRANMMKLKDHPKFKNKFVFINHYTNDEDKIEYMILEELKGEVAEPPSEIQEEQGPLDGTPIDF